MAKEQDRNKPNNKLSIALPLQLHTITRSKPPPEGDITALLRYVLLTSDCNIFLEGIGSIVPPPGGGEFRAQTQVLGGGCMSFTLV